jgi:hypothetical protein
MNFYATGVLVAAIAGLTSSALAQQTADSHFAAAKAAAGTDHVALFEATCVRTPGPPPALTGPREVPERSTWHHEQVKVFDNLYYIGEGIFGLGRDHLRRHHRDRHDLGPLGRGRDRRRPEEARLRPG